MPIQYKTGVVLGMAGIVCPFVLAVLTVFGVRGITFEQWIAAIFILVGGMVLTGITMSLFEDYKKERAKSASMNVNK